MPYHQTALNIWIFVIVTKRVFCERTTKILNVTYVKFAFLGHSVILADSRRPLTAENLVRPPGFVIDKVALRYASRLAHVSIITKMY